MAACVCFSCLSTISCSSSMSSYIVMSSPSPLLLLMCYKNNHRLVVTNWTANTQTHTYVCMYTCTPTHVHTHVHTSTPNMQAHTYIHVHHSNNNRTEVNLYFEADQITIYSTINLNVHGTTQSQKLAHLSHKMAYTKCHMRY